ncbi:hypothetical protein JCM8097_001843 [Rhodosporidiobolus ruineniae]
MAKSTPRATKTAAPSSASKKASTPAGKGTPKSAAPASSSKKRVRVTEPEDVEEEAAPAAAAPAPTSAKKAKSSKAASAAAAAAPADDETAAEPTPTKKGKNGVVLRDLRDKKLDEIEPIHSREQPSPQRGALKKGKGKVVEVAPEAEDNDEEELDFLEGFESGEEDSDEGADSSDEEEAGAEAEKKRQEQAKKLVAQLPKVKGGDKAVEKKVEKKEKKAPKAGVVYLGRIPKGFYEEEMRSYFSQFGEVTRLRLSRNKKTGASKHYAFIEFKYASVAEIVHETMDNYLLAGHILVCKVVPEDQVHPKLWVGANRKFRVVPVARKEQKRREKPKTDAELATAQKRLLTREDKKRAQLVELGIEYDFAGFAGKKVEGEEEKEEPKAEKPTPAKGKKGRKSAGGDEPAKKKPRKSK